MGACIPPAELLPPMRLLDPDSVRLKAGAERELSPASESRLSIEGRSCPLLLYEG